MPGNWSLVDWDFNCSSDTFLSRILKRQRRWRDTMMMLFSPRELVLSSTRYFLSASEPITTFSLAMFQNVLSKFLFPKEVHGPAPPVSQATPPSEPFNLSACNLWFDHLCLQEDPGVMTTYDILKFCDGIGKEPDDMVFLILSYKMGVKTCGTISRAEWTTGMSYFKIDSSQKLVEQWEGLRRLLDDDPVFEREVYRFSYDYVRERDRDGGRMDIQSGAELVRMFLHKKWKYCQAFLLFLNLTKVKSLTRDQFMNIIDFSRDVTSLKGYDDSGAWPVLMDEFVAHVHEQRGLYTGVLRFSDLPNNDERSGSPYLDSTEDASKFPL